MNKITIVAFFLIVGLTSCSSQQEVKTNLPCKIESVYFQRWIGGQEETGRGINFHIEFKKTLSGDIKLMKIYFQNQETTFDMLTGNKFVAHFYVRNVNLDFIIEKDSLKEYGNKAPMIKKSKFDLKPNEAMLEYKKKNQTKFLKIINIKEKPMIAYPSMIKPKN